MNGLRDGWLDDWMDGWFDGWMDGWIYNESATANNRADGQYFNGLILNGERLCTFCREIFKI